MVLLGVPGNELAVMVLVDMGEDMAKVAVDDDGAGAAELTVVVALTVVTLAVFRWVAGIWVVVIIEDMASRGWLWPDDVAMLEGMVMVCWPLAEFNVIWLMLAVLAAAVVEFS